MKKSLLTLSMILVSVFAFSQVKIELGAKLGANFANTNIEGAESITALHGGLYGLVKLTKIGIQPEVLFSRQGNSFSGGIERKLDYVNVPVMLKWYLPLGLNLQAGPQFGVLLNAKDQDGEDIKTNFKTSDTSVALGAGWDAPFGLQFTARYVMGLSDLNKTTAGTLEQKSRIIQLSVGYSLFKLGK